MSQTSTPRPTISTPSGCRSLPTAQFKARRACSRAPRACTTSRRTAARSSTARPGFGASMPAIAGARSPRRSQKQAASSTSRPTFQMGHPMAFELAAALAEHHAGRSRPRVLHQFGLGGGRHGAEDRARLSSRARRAGAYAAHRPRARLSRRRISAASRSAASSPTAALRRLLPAVDHLPPHARPGADASPAASRLGRAPCRRARAICRPARRRDHRGGDRRADGGLDGCAAPPVGYLRAPRAICDRTGSCSSSTRSSPASAGSARRSRRSSSA